MSSNGNGCSGTGGAESQGTVSNGSKQATPFNIGTFGVLFAFCIIIALTSSLYYNWPAVERILIDDKVFQNLCTKDEILNAIDGMFVCDKQRIEIGNLALTIFYSEFVAFAIGGILTDIVGVYILLILGFMFGFGAFLILYFFHFSNGMIKLAFAHWGMFGGLVFITSIQFPKMFPQSKSLADGMIILFDNLSGLMPLIIYKLMKCFHLRYYEAFGTYILWGIFPAFLLAIGFIPYKIMPKTFKKEEISTDLFDFKTMTNQYKCFSSSAKDQNLWSNLIVFSIPVTCSIFYKKTFSTYFLKNQTLVRLFPIIMLFVFVPTIFIAALNQFMGVHITSTILYIFYIISFVCFLYPTKQYGLLSIILFVISTSAADQQTMTYISEQHPQNESTLLGISYAVDFIVGAVLQRLFTCIFNRKPKAILLVIVPLFFICIGYSIYCHTQNSSSKVSFRGIFLILWIVPFFILCLNLLLNSISRELKDKSDIQIKTNRFRDYKREKILTVSVVFHSFSFYYVCNTFVILESIFNITRKMGNYEKIQSHSIFLIVCFFVLPQFIIICYSNFSEKTHTNITPIVFSLLVFKFIMFCFSKTMDYDISFISIFSIFLIIYGFVFFLFIYMLAYYNFQITYVERCYKTSLLHWGSIINIFLLFKLFNNILKRYESGHLILWILNTWVFIYFTIVLYLYFPYEMEIKFDFLTSNLPAPILPKFESMPGVLVENSLRNIITNISLTICNFGVLINMAMNKKMVFIFFLGVLIHRVIVICSVNPGYLLDKYDEYISPSLSGLCVITFAILFVGRFFIEDKIYYNSYFNALAMINFLILTCISTLSLLSAQTELQKCCCTDEAQRDRCNCCCISKVAPTKCTCKDITKCCCCCNPGKEGCTCDPLCCQQCQDGKKCQNCVCKCFKKIIRPGYCKHNRYECPIIFMFYKCELRKAKDQFCCFFIGTFSGWILLSVYLAI